MAMGKRKSDQAPMWVASTDLPVSPGHPFYARLNAILDEAGFDRFAEEQCRQFYAPVMGRPNLPPGRDFRLLLVGRLGRPLTGAYKDRKSTPLNSRHTLIPYAVFCLEHKTRQFPAQDTF